jgi:hypothetical protein
MTYGEIVKLANFYRLTQIFSFLTCHTDIFNKETFCYGEVMLQETFCYRDVMLWRRFVWRRFVEETFCAETFCMCADQGGLN